MFCFLIAPNIWEMWVWERGVPGTEWLSGLRSLVCGLRSADGEVRARTVFICSENRQRWWPWHRARCQLLPWGPVSEPETQSKHQPPVPGASVYVFLFPFSPRSPPSAFLLFIFFSDVSKWTLMLRFLNGRHTLARRRVVVSPRVVLGAQQPPPPPSPEAVTFQSQSPHLEMTYFCHHFTTAPF